MKNKIYVPPLKIQGIKTRLIPWIAENVALSSETRWVEPFMGSGVVGFNVAGENALFADSNPHIINFYNKLKKKEIDHLIVREFLYQEGKKLSNKGQEYYNYVRERFNSEHNSLDFLFLNRSCFNGLMRFNRNFKFNVPYGHKPERFAKAYITKIVNQVKYVEFAMSQNNWEFKCRSFEETLSETNKNDFIYCDPPYIGRHVDYYDSWNEENELKLHELLIKSGAKFMLSTWDNNQYRKNKYLESVWKNYNKLNKEHFYHVGAKEINRNPMIEALIINYEIKQTNNLVTEREFIQTELFPEFAKTTI